MKHAVLLFVFLCCSAASADDLPKRPRILGIRHVEIHVSDLPAAKKFYGTLDPGIAECVGCKNSQQSFWLQLSDSQSVLLWNSSSLSRPSLPKSSLLKSIGFEIDDLHRMTEFLRAKGISFQEAYPVDGDPSLTVADPEGYQIEFIQPQRNPMNRPRVATPKSVRLIHAGFVVRNRAATDHFYKDILGFRPYWHGGMKDDKDDWVAMQVPDGTDWVEYMLNISPTADKHTLGVMNHIALGVTDIHATQQLLVKNGWKPGEEPKLGRDGKWQLNVYDPDDTRIEFMEFTPKEKPCCSEFTGPHPGPKQ
jgi:catechol 2,3-dioxygenase-like lactoylglutathione lyase family enzyme